MNNIEIGDTVTDDFVVIDSSAQGVTGLVTGDFTMYLYGPLNTNVIGTVPVTITELGLGNYRASFTPPSVGPYTIIITHPTYLPSGQGGINETYECVQHMDDVDAILEDTSTTIPGLIAVLEGKVDVIDGIVDDVLVDTNEMQGKLPTNYIMGSSVVSDKDDEIDAILEDTSTTIPAQITSVHATTDGLITTVDTNVDSILADTDTMEADLKTYIDGKSDTTDALITTVDDVVDSIESKVDIIDTNVDGIKEKTDELPVYTDTRLTQIEDKIDIIDANVDAALGIAGYNRVIDQQTYVGDRLVSARIRVFSDNTLTTVIKTINVTAEYDTHGRAEDYREVEA
jgi:hypothetical protein